MRCKSVADCYTKRENPLLKSPITSVNLWVSKRKRYGCGAILVRDRGTFSREGVPLGTMVSD